MAGRIADSERPDIDFAALPKAVAAPPPVRKGNAPLTINDIPAPIRALCTESYNTKQSFHQHGLSHVRAEGKRRSPAEEFAALCKLFGELTAKTPGATPISVGASIVVENGKAVVSVFARDRKTRTIGKAAEGATVSEDSTAPGTPITRPTAVK
jgi:hypothetical protein